MNLQEARLAIECAFETDTPIFLWGEAGIGKSSIVQQMAEDMDVELLDLRLSQIDSLDLRGLPYVKDGITYWSPPSFLPTDMDSIGILFLDETPQADPATQKAAYQLIQERRIGDYVLPPGWRIIAAGNPNTERITEALGNRFLHINIEPNISDWSIYATKINISNDIIGMLMSRPELLLATPTDQEDYAYPSPRTWEFASRIHTQHKSSLVYRELMQGLVGEGAVIELMGYVNLLSKLPTIQELAANPTGYDFSDSPSKTAALCLMVVSYADPTNIGLLMGYINTVQKDFQVLVITMINSTKNKLMACPEITTWCLANPDVF